MRITELKEPGALASWLADTAKEGQSVVALDLEWIPRNGRDDEIYSGAVSGPTANDIGFFGAALLPELMQAPEGMTFVMHYASSDLKHLAWAGVPLHEKYPYQDTLILSHLLQENGDHDLGSLVVEHYADDYKAIFKSKYRLPQDAPEDENKVYNAKDTHYTRRLFELLRDGLRADDVPDSLVLHVHMLQRSLFETEIAGIAVDRDYLMGKGVELKTKLAEALPRMREMVQESIDVIECEKWVSEIEKRKSPKGRANVKRPEFNWRSNPDMIDLVYNRLGLTPVTKWSKANRKHQLTLEYEALEQIQHEHPLIPVLMEYKDWDKVYGSFIEGTLAQMINGRVYPSFNVTGTTTGRISHSNPNLSQLPKTGGIKGIYIPDPGYCFVGADYDSLEVYIEAHFTQDPNLLKIINEGVSKHDITAKALNIPRDLAKTVNFAHQYWCLPKKTAKIIKCSLPEGEKFHAKYWDTYTGCRDLKRRTDEMVNRGEPVVNYMGRKRRFEAKKRNEFDGAYRQAYNARIQGTGSELTSYSAYTADDEWRRRGWGRLLLTKHDEVITHTRKERAEEAQSRLVEIMVEAGRLAKLSVELKAKSYVMHERWED